MFRGITAINLDSKGRIAIPTRYREPLRDDYEGQMVFTIDTESPCLLLYPLKEWVVIEEKLKQLPGFNAAARRKQRLLIGHATEVEMDGQNRLLVPPPLRQYAGLEKLSVLIGQGHKFEVWDEQTWQASREVWLAQEKEALEKEELPEELQDIAL